MRVLVVEDDPRIAADVAAAHAVPLIDIRLSQMEPTDLRGIPFREGNRVEWSIPSLLPDAKRHGERGILFLDEITSAPPTVTAPFAWKDDPGWRARYGRVDPAEHERLAKAGRERRERQARAAELRKS